MPATLMDKVAKHKYVEAQNTKQTLIGWYQTSDKHKTL